jgi:ligand-binding SRPBCC domain-containing protein
VLLQAVVQGMVWLSQKDRGREQKEEELVDVVLALQFEQLNWPLDHSYERRPKQPIALETCLTV